MRTVRVDGYIVSDAERRISKSGKEYLYFRIGNNEFNDEKGEDGKPKRYWFTITSFNQRHFSMAQHQSLSKEIGAIESIKTMREIVKSHVTSWQTLYTFARGLKIMTMHPKKTLKHL